MKIGNVSQTVQKRSILKQLTYKREESLITPSVEEMCAGISVGAQEDVLTTSTCIYGNEKELCIFAMARVLNGLASRNGKTIGVGFQIQLPSHAYESRIKAMAEHAEHTARAQDVQILSVKAELNPVIQSTLVYAYALGVVEKGRLIQSAMAKAGMDIVLMGCAGTEGALRILNEKEAELSARFVKTFLAPIRKRQRGLFMTTAIEFAISHGASAVHPLGDGGIMAGLWELSEASDIGLEVDFKKILLYQETIEVCEYFRLNPYQLASAGTILAVVPDGEGLVEELRKTDIPAAVLGKTTKGKERVLRNGEERRYLDRPAPDELTRIFEVK